MTIRIQSVGPFESRVLGMGLNRCRPSVSTTTVHYLWLVDRIYCYFYLLCLPITPKGFSRRPTIGQDLLLFLTSFDSTCRPSYKFLREVLVTKFGLIKETEGRLRISTRIEGDSIFPLRDFASTLCRFVMFYFSLE